MSADNGVYIVKFPDGYRVTHAQAIENITYFPAGTQQRKDELIRYFGNSKVFSTEEEALSEARELTEKIDDLEYGINYLGEAESLD